MSRPDDGGAAFPQSSWVWEQASAAIEAADMSEVARDKSGEALAARMGGMTLRDYFATKAMQALIAGSADGGTVDYEEKRVAISAYAMADAMLKQRKQR